LNSRAVPWNAYNQQLEKFNILVKAKNFLVFQGDVEGVASQDSKALAKLIDRISGYVSTLPHKYDLLMLSSLDLAPQYEAAKLAQDKATDASNANFAKKRGMVAEVRHFEEQKSEYRQWEKLRNATVSYNVRFEDRADDQDAAVQRQLLWRLYHITTEINESTRKVEAANDQLTDLRASAVSHDV
jgi:structural maintenance of chromosome 1